MHRIVCAANRYKINGMLILGARHWDSIMRETLRRIGNEDYLGSMWDQGFIDNRGEFLTREQAWFVAESAGQIVRRVGGDDKCLYSENLY